MRSSLKNSNTPKSASLDGIDMRAELLVFESSRVQRLTPRNANRYSYFYELNMSTWEPAIKRRERPPSNSRTEVAFLIPLHLFLVGVSSANRFPEHALDEKRAEEHEDENPPSNRFENILRYDKRVAAISQEQDRLEDFERFCICFIIQSNKPLIPLFN